MIIPDSRQQLSLPRTQSDLASRDEVDDEACRGAVVVGHDLVVDLVVSVQDHGEEVEEVEGDEDGRGAPQNQ